MTNRLAKERSAYLLAHAEQAVDWYPWGEEALALARQTDKPILLSIGYNACHWCHVMAKEAFSDAATVAAMNEGFINIKVDREERPDIDQLYQMAHSLLRRGTGGWPLTIFLSPQGVPFYSGTYFPHEAQGDQPALKDILASVSLVWAEKREALAQQDQALLEKLLIDIAVPQEGVAIDASTATEAVTQLAVAYDAERGGFGHAPKFPHPTDLAMLLDKGAAGDALAKDMALSSLRKMADGGLFDQIGGGFFRYSVDAAWRVPHFEKMLCDNALLLSLYARAYALTQEPLFARVVDLTVAWLLREMRLPEGGFRASLPADDAKGQEGGCYTWQAEDLRKALTPMEWDVCSAHWGLIDAPLVNGNWHLRVARPVEDLARTLDRPAPMLQELVNATREKLRTLRDQRTAPASDEQLLTSWNALLVTALAQAGTLCEQPEWIDVARQTLSHLKQACWTAQGRLLGRPPHDGFLDDHAFLLEAVLAVHAATPRDDDLAFAHVLANTLIERFEDTMHGGFFMTPNDVPPLFFKLKPGPDTATPSGNGTAALALIALNRLAPQQRYLTAASRCVQAFASTVRNDPATHPRLLAAAAALG